MSNEQRHRIEQALSARLRRSTDPHECAALRDRLWVLGRGHRGRHTFGRNERQKRAAL